MIIPYHLSSQFLLVLVIFNFCRIHAAMEKNFSRNPFNSPNNEEPNGSRKRRLEAVEERPFQTSAPPLSANLLPLPLQPSTCLRLDLNRSLPSNSVEVNSTTRLPGQVKGDDQDSLPQYIREHINGMDQIIKQQGQQLTSMFANQQNNLYKRIILTAENRLEETTLELDNAKLRILDIEKMLGYLKGQIEELRSNDQQLEKMLELYKKQLELAQQQEVGDSSQADMNQAELPRCKVCGKGLPTVILWPCHHLCLCKRCEDDIKICPCCGTTKLSSSVVLFP